MQIGHKDAAFKQQFAIELVETLTKLLNSSIGQIVCAIIDQATTTEGETYFLESSIVFQRGDSGMKIAGTYDFGNKNSLVGIQPSVQSTLSILLHEWLHKISVIHNCAGEPYDPDHKESQDAISSILSEGVEKYKLVYKLVDKLKHYTSDEPLTTIPQTWLETLTLAKYEKWEHPREILQWFISHIVGKSLGAYSQGDSITRDDTSFLLELLKRMLRIELTQEGEEKILDEMSSANLGPKEAYLASRIEALKAKKLPESCIKDSFKLFKDLEGNPHELLLSFCNSGASVIFPQIGKYETSQAPSLAVFTDADREELLNNFCKYIMTKEGLENILQKSNSFVLFMQSLTRDNYKATFENKYVTCFQELKQDEVESLMQLESLKGLDMILGYLSHENIKLVSNLLSSHTAVDKLKSFIDQHLEKAPIFLPRLALALPEDATTHELIASNLKRAFPKFFQMPLFNIERQQLLVIDVLSLPKEVLLSSLPLYLEELTKIIRNVRLVGELTTKIAEIIEQFKGQEDCVRLFDAIEAVSKTTDSLKELLPLIDAIQNDTNHDEPQLLGEF